MTFEKYVYIDFHWVDSWQFGPHQRSLDKLWSNESKLLDSINIFVFSMIILRDIYFDKIFNLLLNYIESVKMLTTYFLLSDKRINPIKYEAYHYDHRLSLCNRTSNNIFKFRVFFHKVQIFDMNNIRLILLFDVIF